MSALPQPIATRWSNAAYGVLGAPLAMAALPLFVQIPAYYASHVGVALAPLGWVLFAARLLDMLQDPLFGHMLDRSAQRQKRWMGMAGVVLALAFICLWKPPDPPEMAMPWLVAMLVLAYGAHSMLSIAYLSWGSRLPEQGMHAVPWREGAGLAGVIVASVVPVGILAADPARVDGRITLYCLFFAAVLGLALFLLLRQPAPVMVAQGQPWRESLQELWRNRAFRALLPPYLLNALSAAIPATLALFFIEDQLQQGALAGLFLAAYFGAAALGLPLWSRLARRVGAVACWRLAMLLSMAGFVGAVWLGPGDKLAFLLVCLATGAALGADLLLPPVLLARVVTQAASVGAAFGILTMLGKLALALAGVALPLLAALDYHPGQGPSSSLPLVYAALPCVLKLAALLALGRYGHQHGH
ncbi:MFS transporter [uncultured Herbaspirillum sp.]|uniref:MFS transporter n=1 Tax=uncultured Herbaspirillum sp. TaxID=160236 RepID=UPI0025892526|nr:MFS transporter [uncultured Herbaspirillum sp.]